LKCCPSSDPVALNAQQEPHWAEKKSTISVKAKTYKTKNKRDKEVLEGKEEEVKEREVERTRRKK